MFRDLSLVDLDLPFLQNTMYKALKLVKIFCVCVWGEREREHCVNNRMKTYFIGLRIAARMNKIEKTKNM